MSFKKALSTVRRFPSLFNRLASHWRRRPASVSDISSFQGPGPTVGGIDLTEGCLITRTVRYTHQLVHWINEAENPYIRNNNLLEDIIQDLGIIQYEQKFSLDDPCNLSLLNPELHAALDVYGLIAVTASAPTLDNLITMVRFDNDRRQRKADQGIPLEAVPQRVLDFSNSSFLDPEYELIALHPYHLLPDDSDLSVYDRTTKTSKRYVAASDQCLRESPKSDSNSPRFPAFHHTFERRNKTTHLNVFLVILNADMKFRQYFALDPPVTPLPKDILTLMNNTMELVDLLYWRPVKSHEAGMLNSDYGRAFLGDHDLMMSIH